MDANTTIQAGILTTDNIAIYGAITGTVAILIGFLQYRYTIKEKEIKLKFKIEKVPDYEQKILTINDKYNPNTGTGGNAKVLYTLEVFNIGNYRTYLNKIYAKSEDGLEHNVLLKIKRGLHNTEFLEKLSTQHQEFIEPKTSKKYPIYFDSNSTNFILKKCIVVDGSGKEWEYEL